MQINLDSIIINRIPIHLKDKIVGTWINVENFNKGSYFKNKDQYIFLTDLQSLNALTVSIDKEDLELAKSHFFELEMAADTEVVDLKLKGHYTDFGKIKDEIERLNPMVGIFGQAQPMLDVISKLNDRIFSRGYRSLVGMGIGLTPSGDDFLAGIMAYERASGNMLIKEQLPLQNTNYISAEFLKYAKKGFFSESIIKLFNDDKNFVSKILESGHTSGGDTLFGIYYAIAMEE